MSAKAVVKGLGQGIPASVETLEQARIAAEPGRGEHRQHRVDIKAFKGRGTAGTLLPDRAVPAAGGSRLLRDALAAVERVHGEMIKLAQLTHEVVGRDAYLCLHRRANTQQLSLRWRRADTASAHVPWPKVPELFRRYLPAMLLWYQEVDRQARALNQREKACRYALKHARREADLVRSERARTSGSGS